MKNLLRIAIMLSCLGVSGWWWGGNPCDNNKYTVLSKINGVGSGIKFIATEDTSDKKLIALASSACGSRWCKLLIWGEASEAGKRLPLTEKQVSTQIASYTHNPNTGHESLIVRGRNVEMGECSNK